MRVIISKLKNDAGETITEVLVAGLVAALGVLLFAMMTVAATRIATRGIQRLSEIAVVEQQMETKNTTAKGFNITITIGQTDDNRRAFTAKASTVTVYENDENEIYAYTKE